MGREEMEKQLGREEGGIGERKDNERNRFVGQGGDIGRARKG